MDKIILTLDEIKAEPITIQSQVKVFLWAMILIPWSFIVHLFFTLIGMFQIPGNVIDIVTLGEKTKAAIKRKSSANL